MLYLVKWPDETYALVSADSNEHLFEVLDEQGDPYAATFEAYHGPVWVEFGPLRDRLDECQEVHNRDQVPQGDGPDLSLMELVRKQTLEHFDTDAEGEEQTGDVDSSGGDLIDGAVLLYSPHVEVPGVDMGTEMNDTLLEFAHPHVLELYNADELDEGITRAAFLQALERDKGEPLAEDFAGHHPRWYREGVAAGDLKPDPEAFPFVVVSDE